MEQYIAFRSQCLDRLTEGNLTKETFIETMARYFEEGNFTPVKNVKLFDQALFNYQYYNVRAKMNMMVFKEHEIRDLAFALEHRDLAFEDYTRKDQMILKMLDIEGYGAVEGYYISMNSKDLEGELFEIVFLDKERVILHTKDKRVLRRLRNNKCFDEKLRPSLISDYVNKSF